MDNDQPSYDDDFYSIHMQQEKLAFREQQLGRIVADLTRYLNLIYKREDIDRDDKLLAKLKVLK